MTVDERNEPLPANDSVPTDTAFVLTVTAAEPDTASVVGENVEGTVNAKVPAPANVHAPTVAEATDVTDTDDDVLAVRVTAPVLLTAPKVMAPVVVLTDNVPAPETPPALTNPDTDCKVIVVAVSVMAVLAHWIVPVPLRTTATTIATSNSEQQTSVIASIPTAFARKQTESESTGTQRTSTGSRQLGRWYLT